MPWSPDHYPDAERIITLQQDMDALASEWSVEMYTIGGWRAIEIKEPILVLVTPDEEPQHGPVGDWLVDHAQRRQRGVIAKTMFEFLVGIQT